MLPAAVGGTPCDVSLRLGFGVRLLRRIDVVLRSLLHVQVNQQSLCAAVRAAVNLHFGLEDDVCVLQVLLHVEVTGQVDTLSGDTNLEGTQTLNLHAVRVLQLGLHDLHQLGQYGLHVRQLGGTVALDGLGQVVLVDCTSPYLTGEPLAKSRTLGVLVPVKSVKL